MLLSEDDVKRRTRLRRAAMRWAIRLAMATIREACRECDPDAVVHVYLTKACEQLQQADNYLRLEYDLEVYKRDGTWVSGRK